MNPEMKAKALEKLMMVLDEVLGEDVMSRMKSKVEEKTGESEEGEEESPEIEIEMPEKGEEEKPEGVGMEATKVEVAAMPKPGLMKKMRGLK